MKKLFSVVLLAFCLAATTRSRGQSIVLVADNIKGASIASPGAIDVSSLGTNVACTACMVTPVNGASTGKGIGGKMVFNMNNEAAVNNFKSALMTGSNKNGSAYFVFSKSSAGGKLVNYYYIKLVNFTVIEVDEASESGSGTNVQVSLGYSGLIWTIKPQSPKGDFGTPTSYGWDFSKQTELSGTAIPSGY